MSFNDFWSVYPKKSEKLYARNCYSKAILKGAKEQDVLEGAKRYASHCLSTNVERQFIKNASTWLNRGCWDDEYDIPQQSIADPNETRWRARISGFLANGWWQESWGPNPNQDGCKAPPSLIGKNIINFRRIV